MMRAVVPQNPITLDSKVLVKFMPKMPAIMAPRPAAKLPMERVSSRRLTYKVPAQLSRGILPPSNIISQKCIHTILLIQYGLFICEKATFLLANPPKPRASPEMSYNVTEQ